MSGKTRMTADERKRAIIDAAKPLFAEKGFSGTSVRHIAKAAKVSEALLYRHFPSKEAMYRVILNYTGSMSSAALTEMKSMEPGAETLVQLINILYYTILFEVPGKRDEQKVHERLLFYSLLEDGGYAKMVFEKIIGTFYELIEKSYEAGIREGDIARGDCSPVNIFWFTHHLAMALNLCHLADDPAFEYRGTKRGMAAEAVSFVLRGIGMTDAAITRYAKSDKIKGLLKKMSRS
jgi:AcrR family transcriptional regulator